MVTNSSDNNGSLVREREYFDQLVEKQGDFNPFTQDGWNSLRKQFRKSTSPSTPIRILDIGCGTGQSRQIYIDNASYYLGVDLSAQSIAVAKAKFLESEWQVADARNLPLASESFDLVAFSSVLHHIPNFTEALKEAGRVLRPGGIVFAFDPNLLHPAMALLRHPKSPFYLSQGVSPDERPLLPSTLKNAFQQAGLTHIRQRCLSNLPYRAVAPRGINAFLSIYNQADRLWAWSGLGYFFGTFVITWARKQDY